jgi:hypothetical protein
MSLAGCGDESGSPSAPVSDRLISDPALAAIRDLVARAAPEAATSVDLDTCPLGDMAALLAAGPAEVAAFAVEPNVSQYVYRSDVDGEHPLVACVASADAVDGYVGINISEVAADFKADTERVLSTFDVTFEDEYAYRGGTVLQYCATPLTDGGGDAFCEVDWYDGNLFTGVFVATDSRSVALADEWLRAVLPRLLVGVVSGAASATPM